MNYAIFQVFTGVKMPVLVLMEVPLCGLVDINILSRTYYLHLQG